MLNQQNQWLSSVDSYIQPLLMRVFTAEKFGVSYGTVEVNSVSSSCDKMKGDRFKLSIPYAKQNLTWNVFFDSQCPEMGPDFLFNDDSFLADMDVDTMSKKIPSLAQWNPNDKNALVNVLIDLLSCYKQYQVQLLQKQNRLQIEYNMLMRSAEVKSEDVEIILLPLGSKPIEAKFLISFPIDTSMLPNRNSDPRNNIAMLLVTFCGADWNRIIPELTLSSFLEDVLGGPNALYLPSFLSKMCLEDYVLEVKNYIQGKVNSIVQSLEKRRDFVTQILAFTSCTVLEYDSINFTYIAILNEQNFKCVTIIKIPLGFPREKPTVTLHSMYYMTEEGYPRYEIINNFDPRTQSVTEIVKRLQIFICQSIEKFKHNVLSNLNIVED